MSTFQYTNPLNTSLAVVGPSSPTSLSQFYGTNFSTYGIGGYMEVWSLNDLNFSTFGATGQIQNSGNTIPVNLYIRPVATLTDKLLLNSDNISTGRRRLGMLVYVYQSNTVYQFSIDNYDTLYNNANADGCIVANGSIGYYVYDRVGGAEKTSGHALISAWTGSTIEGVSGTTRSNANWRVFHDPNNIAVTGATYYSGSGTLT